MGLLQAFLDGEGILAGDGGMSTMLIAGGQSPDDCLEWLNDGEPEAVLAVHEAYLEAGADVLTTNTFGGNFPRLASYGLAGRMHELNLAGARLARKVADGAGREVLVAGSVGPAYPPSDEGDFPYKDAVDTVSNQCRALAEGGANFIFLETMRSVEQVQASLEGARAACGLPVFCTMSFHDRGRTSSGLAPEAAVRELGAAGLEAFGAGCGAGPEGMEEILRKIFSESPKFPVIAQSNAGLPRRENSRLVYGLTPGEMADHALRCLEIGARYIGGCCGTTPADIRAAARALRGAAFH